MSVPNELLDILDHLVETHGVWNLGLSQLEAKAKLEALRAANVVNTLDDLAQEIAQPVDPVPPAGSQFAAPVTPVMPNV